MGLGAQNSNGSQRRPGTFNGASNFVVNQPTFVENQANIISHLAAGEQIRL